MTLGIAGIAHILCDLKKSTMWEDPIGASVEIHGIKTGHLGRSCEEHDYCGSTLDIDTVLRLKKVVVQSGKST